METAAPNGSASAAFAHPARRGASASTQSQPGPPQRRTSNGKASHASIARGGRTTRAKSLPNLVTFIGAACAPTSVRARGGTLAEVGIVLAAAVLGALLVRQLHATYPLPLHVDEWFGLAHVRALLDAGTTRYVEPYYGLGPNGDTLEIGYHVLLATASAATWTPAAPSRSTPPARPGSVSSGGSCSTCTAPSRS